VQIKSYNELIQYYNVFDLGRVYELITPVKPYKHLLGLWCLTPLSTVCWIREQSYTCVTIIFLSYS